MNKNIFEQENEHLNYILTKLLLAKNTLEKAMGSMGIENLEKLRELRESPETDPHDLLFFIERLHEQNAAFNFKDKIQRLEEMSSSLKEPYFSRLMLIDENKRVDDIYIGKFGYTEEKPVITDWRAKIASVYYRYRYPQKKIKYETPDGIEIRDLTLKRTFEIEDGKLIKYYNNDIQLDESEIIAEKIKKRTGGVLEDIVETIQESQLDIIEADPRQICIVQGCVGSGKSTVAIHKLSHVFFNYTNLIHPERSILIAKNQILVGYLSTLFPKLGIFDINYKTLRDLVVNLVFREELNFQFDLDKNADTSRFTLADILKVEEIISQIHDNYEDDINKMFARDEFLSFAGYVYNRKSSVCDNLNEIIDEMEEELTLQKGYLDEEPNSPRSWLFKDNVKALRKIITNVKNMRLRLRNHALPDLAKQLGLNFSEKLDYLNTLIYLFVYSELVGFTKWQKYEYCVVDEGQDFSILEYLILGKLVINGRFSILGDLNQAYSEEGITTWNEIEKVIKDAKNAQTFELKTNYRSTKPIIELATKILKPYTKKYLPKSINRIGLPVEFHKNSTYSDMLNKFETEVSKDLKNLSKSLGIICFDTEIFDKANEILKSLDISKNHYIKLDSRKSITYIPTGVYLMAFDDCKGLEFSKIYILDLNLDKVKNFKDAKKAFVAVTRAMNELVVFSLD